MRHRHFPVLAAAVLACGTVPALALSPDDIVVLFNTRSPHSLRIARYYMNARKIPANHLLPITCDAGEGISEELYRTSVVPQFKKELADRKLTDSVKCVVTTYDIPLRIAARQVTPREQVEITALQKELDAAMKAVEGQIPAYDAIAAPSAPPAPAATAPATAPTLESLTVRLNAAANAAAARADALPADARGIALQQFMRVHERVVGIRGVAAVMQIPPSAPAADPARQILNDLAARARTLEEQYNALPNAATQPALRRKAIELRTQIDGLFGRVRALQEVLAYLQPANTESCFDNELALALVDQPYALTNWFPNFFNLEQHAALLRTPTGAALKSTLLVARMDGSTPAKVEEIIDTTLAVEKSGLDGTLYLDARGLHGTDAYAIFDADLRRTADWLKDHSTLPVVLDDKPELLEAKNCPNAALYCGWYSLNSYKDSCQWLPGAVGYHVASLEMPSLHRPGETGWVVNLLNHGFCGTLGATDEPYLTSFPKPSFFFPLLLSGEFTQGEVWQLTAPMTSWRVGYVGDPLYSPFKAKPRVNVDDLKSDTMLRNAFTILRSPAPQPVR